jgi:predicted transcriptional regulator
MHSISIAIPAEAADRLRELARRERRSPRQQAAVLVLAGLDREGTGQRPDDDPPAGTTTGHRAVRPERQP